MPATYHHGHLRQALMDRATEALAATGIEALSLRGLARTLGVSHAAPLKHFKTKADLLGAIAVEGAQSLLKHAQSVQTLPSGKERILATSRAYIQWAIENPAYYNLLRTPEVMRQAPERLRQLMSNFEEGQRSEIKAAQSKGWRSGSETEALFLHLTVLTLGSAVVATDQIQTETKSSFTVPDALLAPIEQFLNLHTDHSLDQ